MSKKTDSTTTGPKPYHVSIQFTPDEKSRIAVLVAKKEADADLPPGTIPFGAFIKSAILKMAPALPQTSPESVPGPTPSN